MRAGADNVTHKSYITASEAGVWVFASVKVITEFVIRGVCGCIMEVKGIRGTA